MKAKLQEDSIVAEVRKVKEKLAARFNYDVVAMLRDQQKRQASSGHKYVDLSAARAKTSKRKPSK